MWGEMKSSNGGVRMAVLRALVCATVLMLATPGKASADPARFDIAAQPLPTALKNFAAQAKMQLLYRYDIVSHATASPVTGRLDRHAALDLLLRGTGLEAVYSNDNTATIRLISAEDKQPPAPKPQPAARSPRPRRLQRAPPRQMRIRDTSASPRPLRTHRRIEAPPQIAPRSPVPSRK